MPDLPIDTLFIVGLLLASFVGKLLEGRKKSRKPAEEHPKQKSSQDYSIDTEEKKTLSDILRETFGEVIEQATPKEYSSNDSRGDNVTEPKANTRSTAVTNAKPIRKSKPTPSTENEACQKTGKSTLTWIKNEAFASKSSVRKAFLLKEILDQPPGLRRSSF
jgi:hypothetical protein